MSAAVSLSQAVLHDGQPQVERYLGFLRSGGSQFPLPTLQAAGVDMATAQPIEHTLRLFAQTGDRTRDAARVGSSDLSDLSDRPIWPALDIGNSIPAWKTPKSARSSQRRVIMNWASGGRPGGSSTLSPRPPSAVPMCSNCGSWCSSMSRNGARRSPSHASLQRWLRKRRGAGSIQLFASITWDAPGRRCRPSSPRPHSLREKAIFYYNLACYSCVLGQIDAAREALMRSFALDKRYRDFARGDRDLEPLHGELK